KCWSYPLAEIEATDLVSDGSNVFIGADGAMVQALSFEGKKIWSSELGGDISSNILPLETGLFLVTSTISGDDDRAGNSMLRSLSKETGVTTWTVKLPDAKRHFLGAFNGALIVVSRNGIIQSIDAKSGKVRWRREIAENFVAAPAFTAEKVLVASSVKQIFSISLSSGEIESMRKLSFVVTAIGETPTGEIVAGDERGNIFSLWSINEKPLWKFKSGGAISRISTAGTSILAASHDNFVYYLTARNGDVAWKKRLSGRNSLLGNIDGRYALISSFDENNAVIADLASGKVAGVIIFEDEETPVSAPATSNGLIFLLTNKAAYAYSLDGCSTHKKGGPDIISATANLK
ncbi:MAG: PQQ-binding-like beta-propeller repeat protein, partial [Pyrinomonadaceae bacterium]